FCSRDTGDTVCIATSATIADHRNPNAASDFASRFFGVDKASVVTVSEAYEQEVWSSKRKTPSLPKKDTGEILNACVSAVEDINGDGAALRAVYHDLAGINLPAGSCQEALYDD